METENALFVCTNCAVNLGLTGQSHFMNTEDGGEIWACEPKGRTTRMESFAAAHRGACPACGIFDNGNHIVHRYWRTDYNGDFITPDGNRQCYEIFVEAKVKKAKEFMRRDLLARGK